MQIQEVIRIINQMQADGVVDRYAIGGAVGATFYLEPLATLDVDVFISFKSRPGSLLISLEPILDYLKLRGGRMDGEHIVLAGWPVQLLPPNTPLVVEALAQAEERVVAGLPVRVFTAEHLAAIALQTGRAKDKARLLQFVESAALDEARFQEILARHGLGVMWKRFEQQFLAQ
jgi:hypothetical protein